MAIRWPWSSSVDKFGREVKKISLLLQNGKVLSIDPASVSAGWAYFEGGRLLNKGIIDLDKNQSMPDRLKLLHARLKALPPPDVVIIEHIQGSHAHDYLKYSIGATIVSFKTLHTLFCPIPLWKAYSKHQTNYTKTDDNDAQMIGESTIAFSYDLGA